MRSSLRVLIVTLLTLAALLLPAAAHADDGWLDELVDASATSHAYCDIAVDANGAPHIVYQDEVSNTLRYAWRDAGIWQTEQVDTEGYWASIAAAPDGTLHIAYQKLSDTSLWHAWGSHGAWQTEPVDNTHPRDGDRCAIAVDSAGEPHIAWDAYSALVYAYHDLSGWHVEQLPSWGLAHRRVHLTLGPGDQPFVARSFQYQPSQEWLDDTVELLWRETDGWQTACYFEYDEAQGMPVWSTMGFGDGVVAVDPFGVAHLASVDVGEFATGHGGLVHTERQRHSWTHRVVSTTLGTWPDIAVDGAFWPVMVDRGDHQGQPILSLVAQTVNGDVTTSWPINSASTTCRQLQALALDGESREHIVYVSGGELRYLARVTPRTLAPVQGLGEPWIANYTPQRGGWMGQDMHPRMLGDADGDGKDDIVAFGNQATYVSLSTGAAFQPQEAWILCYGPQSGGWSSYDTFPRMLGDVDGDGKDDIVAFGNKATYVSLSTGTSFDPPLEWIRLYGPAAGGWTNYDTFPRMVDDVNGDGKDDIVAFGNKATYVSLSTGASFGPPTPWAMGLGPEAGGWMTQDGQTRLVGDVDGDDRTDIIACGHTATYIWRSTTSALGTYSWFFTTEDGWRSQNMYPRGLGDANGDDKLDLVGFGSDGVYVQLAP